ncbi:MAG: large exoprotein [Candidatus Microbacterium phytovorans]|uniref:Large exoprotein n=1 Tax=Candidatus Microbacterium phytovorans TaxID=3121374 RepID=A0AAJ5W2Z3_9MICO|nr:large exoprotein [Microbacterium sp.]WEK14874.1 MAG: large exoprotein [Microbacterium sp.]
MDGQVLGGGVIVLVAVVLWLVYLLPSWHGRYQYNAAERNAVRLNQALRVLAETSETPDEVRLELNARTALAQQKLARRAQAEREQLERDTARAEHEAAQARAAAEAALARQRVLAEREQALALAAAAAQDPATRRARARRRARLLITVVAAAALALAGWGVLEITRAGSPAALVAGVVVAVVALLMLQRMAAVQRRGLRRTAVVEVARPVASVQDVSLATERAAWTPRELPRPLTASAGSRASALLDAAAAQEALRLAAVDEAMRERAERDAPPSIDTARRPAASTPDFARMGYVDDAAIEEHVRSLLARRAVGA